MDAALRGMPPPRPGGLRSRFIYVATGIIGTLRGSTGRQRREIRCNSCTVLLNVKEGAFGFLALFVLGCASLKVCLAQKTSRPKRVVKQTKAFVMHWLDTTLLAALSLGAALGFLSGLFWQVARIVSFAAAVAATIFLHEPAVAFLSTAVLKNAEPALIKTAAYLGVFLLAYTVLFLVTRLLRMWIRSTEMAPLDRLLGALLGLGKVALVLAVACWALPRWPHAGAREWHDESTLAPLFARGFDAALTQVPERYKQPILERFDQWRGHVGEPPV